MSIIAQTLIAERKQYAPLYVIILHETAPFFYVGSSLACKLKRQSSQDKAKGGDNAKSQDKDGGQNKDSQNKDSQDHVAKLTDLTTLVNNFDLDDFALEFYGCSKCPGHTSSFIDTLRLIADKLYAYLVEHKLPHFIILKTDIPYQKYTILLDDSRALATFYELSEQFMQTILSKKSSKADRTYSGLHLLPTKAQLVDIYRDLSSPQPDLWEIQLPRMRDLLKTTGGDDRPDALAAESARSRIIEKFVANNTEVILLGDHAMQAKAGKPFRNRIIQLLAVNPAALARDISLFIQLSAITSISEAIMRDRRLQRTSIRAHGADLVHIYHNLLYDVVGYNLHQLGNKQIQIGSAPVLARFILIDYWLLVGKFAQGRVPEQFFLTKKAEILEHFVTVSNVDMADFPPPSQFMGQYISDAEYAKQVRKDISFPPYYPAK